MSGLHYSALFIDPSLYTPYYDSALLEGSAGIDFSMRWLGSRDVRGLLGDRARPEEFFYRLTNAIFRQRRPLVRSMAKAVEHLFDMNRLVGQTKAAAVAHFQWSVLPAADLRYWERIKRAGSGLAYTVHNLLPHVARPGDRERYRMLYQAADRLLVHCPATRNELVEQFEIHPAKVRIVQHPILTIPAPDPTDEEVLEVAGRSGLGERDKVALLFGSIELYKGPDLALEMLGHIAGRVKRAKLVLAGNIEPALARMLQRKAAELGVYRRVVLLSRFLSNSEMKAIIKRADVCIFPYREISQSGAIMTALGEGRPLVAFDVGGLGMAVEHGGNGFLVPPLDINAMAAAVSEIMENDGLSAKMASKSMKMAKDDFSPRACFLQNLSVYQEFIQ